MANSSSAKKRIRSSARRHDRNRRVRSAVRTAVARVRQAETDESQEALRRAVSALDKAAQHGVLHPRNASRRKSRLMRQSVVTTASEAAAPRRRAAAQGTKAKAVSRTRKAAPAKGRAATKTERTASTQRRTAGRKDS
ncbi:MAG: 30S ribosomal protein S20 [Candidatus Dormibacteria bacterium]